MSHAHSLNRAPQRVRQAQSLHDKEREWLSKHQSQTVEDWRLAALERREKLERELQSDNAHNVTPAEEGRETGTMSAYEERHLPRERHRCSTLRILSGLDAPPSWQTTTSGSGSGDALLAMKDEVGKTLATTLAKRPEQQALPDTIVTTADMATLSAQAVEQRLLQTLMPLLQSMESTLRDIQASKNTHQELTTQQLTDSMRAVTPSSIDPPKVASSSDHDAVSP